MPVEAYSAASAFTVLGEPHRRRILDLLRERPRSVGELVDALGLSQPGTSKHLRVLLNSRFVDVRQDAQRRVDALRTEPFEEVAAWLEPYSAASKDRLDRLEQVLGNEEEPP
jgi:DNA-binding transcriptional ArsR family regulator